MGPDGRKMLALPCSPCESVTTTEYVPEPSIVGTCWVEPLDQSVGVGWDAIGHVRSQLPIPIVAVLGGDDADGHGQGQGRSGQEAE
jgi:hypothetical protein